MYPKHGAYWLVKKKKWTRLGADLRSSLIAYARLTAPASGAMAAFIDEAMAEILPGVKASTRKQYEYAARKLKEILIEFEPDQVQQSDMAGVKRAFRSKPNMGNRVLSVARQIFAFGVEDGRIANNPCVGIIRHAEKKRGRLITWTEYYAIWEKGPLRLRVFMHLLFGTGQRPIDVLTLKRADLLPEGIRFEQEKTGAKLIVPWTPEMREAVDRLLGGKVVSIGCLFRSRRGTRMAYRTMYDMWCRACKAAELEDTDLRDLRAFAATEAKKQGKDPTALLGHRSKQMTERYLRDKETPIVEGPRIRRLIDI
jgi:integrase